MLKFTDKKVADQFESPFDYDPMVHLPGDTGTGWKGKLSTIPHWAALKVVDQQSNLLVKKGETSIEIFSQDSE